MLQGESGTARRVGGAGRQAGRQAGRRAMTVRMAMREVRLAGSKVIECEKETLHRNLKSALKP